MEREHVIQWERKLAPGESVALYGLSVATFLACLFFPVISSAIIEPYVYGVFGQSASMSQGNIIIMTIMMVMIMLFPLSFINYGRRVRVTDAYLGGANLQSSVRFLGSANAEQDVAIRNYYLRGFFTEAWLSRWGVICAAALLVAMVSLAARATVLEIRNSKSEMSPAATTPPSGENKPGFRESSNHLPRPQPGSVGASSAATIL